MLPAIAVFISIGVLSALANDSSNMVSREYSANPVTTTCVCNQARILTPGIDTSEMRWTLSIFCAVWFKWFSLTFDVWISFSSWRTRTFWLVVFRLTNSIISTAVLGANLATNSIQPITRFVFSTILIEVTNGMNTSNTWISLSTRRTGTLSSVSGCCTFCSTTAGYKGVKAR